MFSDNFIGASQDALHSSEFFKMVGSESRLNPGLLLVYLCNTFIPSSSSTSSLLSEVGQHGDPNFRGDLIPTDL